MSDIEIGSVWDLDENNNFYVKITGLDLVTGDLKTIREDGIGSSITESELTKHYTPRQTVSDDPMNLLDSGENWYGNKFGEKVEILDVHDGVVYHTFNGDKYKLVKELFLERFTHDSVWQGLGGGATNKAVEILHTSEKTLTRCGKKYDSTGNDSERVMDRVVGMFNAATGHELNEVQGNIFMVCLKVVRSETSTYHDDDHYVDGINYFAMAGEASSMGGDE